MLDQVVRFGAERPQQQFHRLAVSAEEECIFLGSKGSSCRSIFCAGREPLWGAHGIFDLGFGFGAPYLVTELDGSDGETPYQFAAVASAQTLWILSRTPTMDDELYEELVIRLEERGYLADKLEQTLQSEL